MNELGIYFDLSARCSRLSAAQLTARTVPPNVASAVQGETSREAPSHCPRDHSLPCSSCRLCARVKAFMATRPCHSTAALRHGPFILKLNSMRGVRQRQQWWRGAGGSGSKWMVERWRGVMPRLSLAALLLALLHRLVAVSAAPAAPSSSAVRMNCGSSERVVGRDGRVWEADAFYVGGQPASVLASMPLALPPELRSQRVFRASDVSCYDIPLSPGRFIVRLAFAYHSDTLPSAQRDVNPPLEVHSDEGVTTSSLPAYDALQPDALGRRSADSYAPRQPTTYASASPLDDGRVGHGGAAQRHRDSDPADRTPKDKHKARWPRFAVLVEGVQMETVSMGQHVGAVYEPEYIVDSADASLTLCFLPVGFDILREAHGQHNRLVTLPVVVGFSRPAIGSAPTLEVQLVACNGSRLSPLISSIEIIEVVRANVPRENVVSELQAQQKTAGSQASPEAAPSRSSRTGVVAGAIGGVGALVFLALMVPLLLLWRHQHRRRHAMRSQLLEEGVLDSAAAHLEDSAVGPEPPVVGEEVDALVDSGEGSVDFDR
ncbi:unnamed protein product [Closterium sp. NIES-53]